jgi:hypothetical protein
MPAAAPRIPWTIVAAIAGLDDRRAPIAEVWRRTSDLAELLDVPRPSYEQVRRFVHRERRYRAVPGSWDLLVDILLRTKAPLTVLDELIERSLSREAVRQEIAAERTQRGG